MIKSFLAVLALGCSVVFAQVPEDTGTNQTSPDIFLYVPKPEFKDIPKNQILVSPAPGLGNGTAVWCNTLRGRGLLIIGQAGHLIQIVIDCPEKKSDS